MHVLERIYIQTRLGNTSKEQVNLQNNISAIDLLEKLENVQFWTTRVNYFGRYFDKCLHLQLKWQRRRGVEA